MAEEYWDLKTSDGHRIYGALNKPDKKKNTKAVIHIHGLGELISGYPQTVLAHKFPDYGYDVIRPSLYSWGKDARSITDCTIKTFANDINSLIRHFSKKYKKLYAIGHSYGGPSLMSANLNAFTAASFWDPAYIPQKSLPKKDFKLQGKLYISKEGNGKVLGKAMLDEAEKFDQNHARKLSLKRRIPLQVIYAGFDPFWLPLGESFHTNGKGPTDERIVKKTQHFFDEEGAVDPLLRHTRKWFDKF